MCNNSKNENHSPMVFVDYALFNEYKKVYENYQSDTNVLISHYDCIASGHFDSRETNESKFHTKDEAILIAKSINDKLHSEVRELIEIRNQQTEEIAELKRSLTLMHEQPNYKKEAKLWRNIAMLSVIASGAFLMFALFYN